MALSAVVLPAGFLAWTILAYGVDVPFWDQWRVAGLVAKALDGTLSLGDLTSQANESRLVFPRLLFIGLAYLSGYDVRYEMWGTFCLACLVVYNVYRLGRVTLGGDRRREVMGLLLASSLVFSLVQWENWFWGIQLVAFVPLACVTSILSLAYSRRSLGTKFIASAALATLSTFSYTNGMLCWIIVLPVLVLQTWDTRRTKTWVLGGWALALIVNVGLYFRHYAKPLHHPSLTEAFRKPTAAVDYFLTFLGAPLAWGPFEPLDQAPVLGLAMAALFGFMSGYVWRHRHDSVVLFRTAGWLTLGGYTLISAAGITAARLGFGVSTALTSRYATLSFPLIVALVYLVPIVLEVHGQQRGSPAEARLARGGIALAVTLLVLQVTTTETVRSSVESNRWYRLQGKAALLFIRTLPAESLVPPLYHDPHELKRYAEALDRHGRLSPGLRRSLTIAGAELGPTDGGGGCGAFDRFQRTGVETYLAAGWAILPHRREAADGIVLAHEDPNGAFTIFDLVTVRRPRPDVAHALARGEDVRSGWEHAFRLPQIGARPLTIAAWAVDAVTGRLCRLRQSHVAARGDAR